MSDVIFDDVSELIKSYQPATDEQMNGVCHGLGEIAPNSLVWIDDVINDNIKTANQLGMIIKNPKGKAVNLAVLSEKPFLVNYKAEAGAGVFGDLKCDTAYLMDNFDDACSLANGLKEHGAFCVLMAFGGIAKVAKAFCKTHKLILPVYAHQKDELQNKVGSLPNTQIHACIEPVLDTLAHLKGHDNHTQVIKGLDFPYLGGFFAIKDGKLLYSKLNRDTDHVTELFVCNALHIDGMTRDKAGGNWGKLLRFDDPDGNTKTWAMPTALLMGDSREFLKTLASMGLVINTTAKAKALLTAYIQFHPCTDKLLCVDNVGWCGGSYVLPHRIFGEKVILQSNPMTHGYCEQGTLRQWQNNISTPCVHHHRLAFALCVAFAGVVLSPLGEESIGFHFVGASSMGKSLALRLGASVWGNHDFVRTWKATGNGMEGVASLHHDNFLALDELGECDPKQIGNIVYMLGNGQGKQRMSKDTTAKDNKKWRIAYLSTGETTLDNVLKQAGQAIKAGQAVRFAHINADAGHGLGMFDSLAGATSGQALADHLKEQTKHYHGVAGVAWLEYLTTHDYLPTLKAFIDDFTAMYDGLSSQAGRVCKHFAIVAGVGELATLAGVTGWTAGQATKAVKACFDDWLGTYGKHGDLELTALIERIIHTIEQHRYGRMANIKAGDYNPKENWAYGKANLLGYIDGDLYLFTSAGFAEVSEPLPPKQAFKMLQELGMTKSNHRQKYQKFVNGKKWLFYAIKDEIMTFLEG